MMSNIIHDLSQITNFELIKNIIENNDSLEPDKLEIFKLIHKLWARNDKVYHILKYDKVKLNAMATATATATATDEKIGMLRSVVYSNKQILCFSPPKSVKIEKFIDKYCESDCWAEELVEGTMINLFYDPDIKKWEIASKTSVGGDVTYFQDQPTFLKLFNECCEELAINMENFCKDYCYSFVMQHPKNRFVLSIVQKSLYLIAIYKINTTNGTIISIDTRSEQCLCMLGNIRLPVRYGLTTYNEMIDQYGSMNVNINILGVMIYNKTDGARTKIRNPNYEYLKRLRGNNPKIQYQYLCLRKVDQVKQFLKFFPENKAVFGVFRAQLHLFTDNLYTNYIKCYIKRLKPILEFPKQFRVHMYNLHQHYLTIVADKGYINRPAVIKYVNGLEPAQLMYSLNR